MAKLLLLLYLLAILSIASTINATTYMVGDTSGWDVSSDLDTWTHDKAFKVGDVLVFSYSSSNSVYEVTKANYDNCSTNNALKAYTNGNTNLTLSSPGDKYFISGNKLYCLGGMKIDVPVTGPPAPAPAASPIGSPQAQPPSSSSGTKTLPTESAKRNNTSITSAGVSSYGSGRNSLVVVVGFVVSLLWMVHA